MSTRDEEFYEINTTYESCLKKMRLDLTAAIKTYNKCTIIWIWPRIIQLERRSNFRKPLALMSACQIGRRNHTNCCSGNHAIIVTFELKILALYKQSQWKSFQEHNHDFDFKKKKSQKISKFLDRQRMLTHLQDNYQT